jgi:hypothetical protein
MARKDDIFNSFIDHPLIKEKYGHDKENFPSNFGLGLGLISEHVIIRSIALIVDSQEKVPAESDSALQKKVIQYLNQEAI